MSGRVDRRPWVIISANEAAALVQQATGGSADAEPLSRALRMVRNQLAWIDGEPDAEQPESDEGLKQRAEAVG